MLSLIWDIPEAQCCRGARGGRIDWAYLKAVTLKSEEARDESPDSHPPFLKAASVSVDSALLVYPACMLSTFPVAREKPVSQEFQVFTVSSLHKEAKIKGIY